MNDSEQIQIDRFLATELGEQKTLVGIKSSKIMPKFLLTNDTDPLESKDKKFLFYDSGGESSIKVEDGSTSYSYKGYLDKSHMLNVFEKLVIGEKKYTPRLKNVTLNQLISRYFSRGVHIYFKDGDLVLVSNDTPVEIKLKETDVPDPSSTDAIDITNVYNLMGLVGKKGEDGKYEYNKEVTENTKLRYVLHFTIGIQFIFRNDLISVSEDTPLKAVMIPEDTNTKKTTYSLTNKDGKELYFGTQPLNKIGDRYSIYTKSSAERAKFYTNVYKNKSFGNTNINIHNFADYCNEGVFTMKNFNQIEREIDSQLKLQKESAQTESQIYYTTSLDKLFSQEFDNPKKFYSPEGKKLKVRNNYYRKYTTKEGEEVTVELPNKIYTREMRTAIVKRWLQIKHSRAQEASNSEVLFELIPIENEMSSQLVSILFHLINMDFKEAFQYFKYVNYIILNSPELFQWLPNEFKKSSQRDSRRDIMKFKYFHNRITKPYFDKKAPSKLQKDYSSEQHNTTYQLNDIDFSAILFLIGETKRLVVYNEKKKLVAEYFELFKKITSNLVYLEYFQDLDYFFIVFEMLIDTSNKAVKEEMKRLVSEFKYKPPPVPTSPRPGHRPGHRTSPSPGPRPGSPPAKGGSKKHSKKRSFNESSRKTKRKSYN